MDSKTKKVFFENSFFEVYNEVYEPAEDSFLLAENLRATEGSCVLDMGTGTGILGILAAKKSSTVIATDLNPYAVRCAMQNAMLNRVSNKIFFLQGDLFAPISEKIKFDSIFFNAPYLPSVQGEDTSWLGRAWAGGPTGRQVIDRFIIQAPTYLDKDGEILLMQSNLANIEETQKKFASCSMRTQVVASMDLPFFETITVIEAKFINHL